MSGLGPLLSLCSRRRLPHGAAETGPFTVPGAAAVGCGKAIDFAGVKHQRTLECKLTSCEYGMDDLRVKELMQTVTRK